MSCWRDNEHSLHCPATLPASVMWPDVFSFIQNLRKSNQNHYGGRGCLLVREATLPLIELHPCTSVLEGYGGSVTGCTPCGLGLRWNANKYNLGRNTEEQSWILSIRFLLLVSSNSASQKPQKLKDENVQKLSLISPLLSAGIRELSDTYPPPHKKNKKNSWTTPAWLDVWSQRRMCTANVYEVTRQTVGADNHHSPVQSSCISKLKMGR